MPGPGPSSPTLYELLQVRSDATTQDVRHAWRRLAQENHPDRGDADPEAMTRINQAYEVLSDPDRRARYDQEMLARRKPRRRGWLGALQHRARLVTAVALGATVVLAAGAWTVLRPMGAPPAAPRPAPAAAALQPPPADAPLVLIPSRSIESFSRTRAAGTATASRP